MEFSQRPVDVLRDVLLNFDVAEFDEFRVEIARMLLHGWLDVQ